MLPDIGAADLPVSTVPHSNNSQDYVDQSRSVTPIQAELRSMKNAGDRIHTIHGVLSGSLNWLFSNFQQNHSFCQLLDRGRALGITAPNPFFDLSGLEVERKLLVLAREAGFATGPGSVSVSPVVPSGFNNSLPLNKIDRDFLDRHFARLVQAAHARQMVLRYTARIRAGGQLSCGLEPIPAVSRLARAQPGDRAAEIRSDRHQDAPVTITEPTRVSFVNGTSD